jgi:MAF protein
LRLVLASASPRRQALIALLGVEWRAVPTHIDEMAHLADVPLVSALSVASAKLAALAGVATDEIALAADTLVVDDGEALGKPVDARDARSMLERLRDRPHQVLTGIALRDGTAREWGAVVSSRVRMRAYSDAEIADYVARGEPFDKAGAYAVQDELFRPVAGVEGCYLNVVGLPLCAVAAGLRALGADVTTASRPPCDYCRAGAALVSIA